MEDGNQSVVRRGGLTRHRGVCKKGALWDGRRQEEGFESEKKKDDTYPILDHRDLVCPTSRSEPVGDPDHGLDPFPRRET